MALVLVASALASTHTLPPAPAFGRMEFNVGQALATAEPLPSQPASLNAEEQALSAYIAARWKVELSAAQRVVQLAREAAKSNELDPLLVLAVVARESSFRHNGNAGNLNSDVENDDIDPGWAHGLMQVAGRFHPEKMPVDEQGNMRVTTDEENLHIGSRILKEYLRRDRGNLTRALQRYNGNLVEGDTRFAAYVLRVRTQLAKVAARAA
jgi:soluble lytic murein transglycosylase-like protein